MSSKTKRGIYFPLFLILCSLVFISCKEKNIDIRFSGEGKFSHESLVKMIDEPESLSPPDNKKKSNKKAEPEPEPVPMDFYGIDETEMGNIIKSFGDCEGSGSTVFSVELNGLSLKRIYLKKGAEFFFNFSAENELHEKVLETAQKMCDENPALEVKFAENKKSFSVYCKFLEEYVMFDSAVAGEEIDFKKIDMPKKQDGMTFKIKNGKAIITGEDKKLGAYIQFIVEEV